MPFVTFNDLHALSQLFQFSVLNGHGFKSRAISCQRDEVV